MTTRKGRSPIGIDLQHNGAKLVQLAYGKGGPALAAHASVPFDDSLLQIEDRRPQTVIDALKRAIGKGGFKGSAAIVALPPRKVDVRTLTLPGADSDLEKVLRWEGESYLHYAVDKACIDHVKLGEVSVGNEKRTEVLVAAAFRPYVIALLELLDAAGIRAEVVDIAPMALCRMGSAVNHEGGTISITDIGRSASMTVIIDKGSIRLTRITARGGDEFTAKIKNSLEISHDEAELLKIEYGIGTPSQGAAFGADRELVTKTEIAGTIHEILRPDIDEFAAELQKLFRYFSTQTKGAQVTHSYLCGGGSLLKGLADNLTGRTGTKIETLPPLDTLFPNGKGKGSASSCGPEYAVAAGLALREEEERS